jgi:hypothetical protein
LPSQIFVEVLHVPTHVAGPVLADHPDDPVDRHTPHRRLAKAAIGQAAIPILLTASPPAPKLPLRTPQKLTRFLCRKFLVLPAL